MRVRFKKVGMKKINSKPLGLLLVFMLLRWGPSLFAQTNRIGWQIQVMQRDSLFWVAYNHCDTADFARFFTADVEFYHDKGGTTMGRNAMVASIRNNLCGADPTRLRREPVKGSVHLYPLEKQGVLYGAVLTGEHVFYIKQPGKEEFLDGRACFTHVWLLEGMEWKMSRILSYNHHEAREGAGER